MSHEKIVIAILGSYDTQRLPRKSIQPALHQSAEKLCISIETIWLENHELQTLNSESIHGLFIAPGAPDEAHDKILNAITLARLNKIPLIATCGGFQRVIVEYLQRELLYNSPLHYQELEPQAQNPLFIQLSCHIEPLLMPVNIAIGTKTQVFYQTEQSTESFYCRYGVNPDYWNALLTHDLIISGTDSEQIPRIIELKNHPFYIATLFVPQVLSSQHFPHPLINEFLKACVIQSHHTIKLRYTQGI